MVTKIQKWGNSQGLRFPLEILRQASISVGEEVAISVKKGTIIIKSSDSIRGKYELKDLVAKMPVKYNVAEEDFGKPEGREFW